MIYIGSKNPTKVNAVKAVFKEENIISMDAPSSVPAQPFSDQETRKGAIQRAKFLIENMEAVIAIGLEGGVSDEEEGMFLCNWGALVTKEGKIYVGGGARILLPEEIAYHIRQGAELGDVIDHWANKNDIRKKEGTIGIFTDGIVTRESMFEHVVRLLYGQWRFYKGKVAE